MLMTLAKFQARPGAVSSLLDLARTLVKHSRSGTGCLEYGCYQDIINSDTLLLVGRWTGQEALETHYESAHFRDLVRQFKDWVVEAPPSVSLYDVIEMDHL
ncbi:MAG TPA: putative quinol monooxygenase [Candidatus Competibacteraceae bacterium]|nr:putative quinol monooxygenase [Candidatus Competibacteraceae bacterium]HRZ05669.1 putative quinol monooxygenase [Candidatus Competibacteraceae bacterium]HSA45716.1 putative quinol monooxygenase [Candidatus Competibacteraceae bacterium]